MAARILEMISRFSLARFLVSGGFNTVLTYLVYLIALNWLSYAWSYSLAYALGIVLAFILNRSYVFKSDRGWRSVILFPFVYLAQYLISMLVLRVWIDHLGWRAELAPLMAIVVSLPVTYVLSRLVFGYKNDL